ncbi:sprouty protein evh1 domain containing protein, putative [Pediculus humanus corporis]|uniref:Sprouty protein evh1 domain containing protein, putative n=1 Tax=Pediculus humanus subsp. corporis TaxID=121224 RepID=E0W238_PEDHC|nr:sprouty protein evh1 domain containing protein, putative [Pediculus humanus corporis]EEB19694.1 sprouty protein evh1 domain containing protein, putative [Pediculus humanus corporis]
MNQRRSFNGINVTLNLPVERGDSRSSSDSSTRGSKHPTPPQEQILQKGHFINRGKLGSELESPSSHTDNYPYVQLTTVHEYIYPGADASKVSQHDSTTGSLKKRSLEALPPPTAKQGKKEMRKLGRQRCRYCQELFVEEENKKGACEYAPDCIRSAIDEVSCVRCARCMLYHCMADAEGDFAQHPCECTSDEGCSRRWLGLAILSILVPCLWLYPPLRACHWCGVRCGLCGGRHRPAS